MSTHDLPTRAEERRNSPEQAVFQQAWRIYRVLIDENYMFHREAYACLRRVLNEGIGCPFRFLDIACGDATPSVEALQGTAITAYYGIDLSEAALDLARQNLTVLSCPVTLVHADFVDALETWTAPVDVAWIGFSLHHMTTDEKLTVLRMIRTILPETGHLLFYEDTSPDGETREGWLARWDAQGPDWTAYAPEDWAAITAHVHEADYPETVSTWKTLAREAGFAAAREVYVSPSNLFRLFWLPVTDGGADAVMPARVAEPGVSDDAVERATGRNWDAWLQMLDGWGAGQKTHAEIARHVHETYGVSGWWAQSVAVGYERARGMRAIHERPDGFSVNASRTFPVPVERLFAALTEEAERSQWLAGLELRQRTSKPHSSARFDVPPGDTRLNVTFIARGPAKSVAQFQQERLASAGDVETWRAVWKKHLAALAHYLASDDSGDT